MIIRKRGINHQNFPRKAEAVQIVRSIQRLARSLYPEFTLTDEELPIVFFNGGTTGGWAKTRTVGLRLIYNLELNVQAIEVDWDHITFETIPHEMAHIVNRYINGKKVKAHGWEWKRIAQRLGCKGKRTHEMPLQKIRHRQPSRKFAYVATCGTKIEISSIRHGRVQRGSYYTLKHTRGKITANCFIGEVGKVNAYVNVGI